jgi:uncharacterized protein YjiS (DUF1127 family)
MQTSTSALRKELFTSANLAPSWRHRLIATIREWHHRATSRRLLAAMSPLERKDLARWAEYEAERYKPFWRE